MKQTLAAERAGFSDSDFSNMFNKRRKGIYSLRSKTMSEIDGNLYAGAA